MSRYLLVLLLVLAAGSGSAQEAVPLPVQAAPRNYYADSAARARRDSVRAAKDSIRRVNDSLSLVWTRAGDPQRANQFVDSLVRLNTVTALDFRAHARKFPVGVSRYDLGRPRPRGEVWIPAFILLLLIFFAVLRRVYAKDILLIFQSFISNRVLAQVSKESRLFSSWPFVLLYILFGFTIGMVLYLSAGYFQLAYMYSGFQLLCILSGGVIVLFGLKILLVKVVGFLFDVTRLTNEYSSVLFLSYFHAAILYLPLIVAFSLTPQKYASVYIYIALALIVLVFFFQLIRGGTNILSTNRFPKVYLMIYLCALEVCPILILIKALRF